VIAGNGDGTFTPTYEVTRFDKLGNRADVNGDGRTGLAVSFTHPGDNGAGSAACLQIRPIVGQKEQGRKPELNGSTVQLLPASNIPYTEGGNWTCQDYRSGFKAKRTFSTSLDSSTANSTILVPTSSQDSISSPIP